MIQEVVLTGGPCGGKSTAMKLLAERLVDRGIGVILVEEAATRQFGRLANPGAVALLLKNPGTRVGMQRLLVATQVQDQAQARTLAALLPQKRVVILYDRGVIDNAAYIPVGEFAPILAEQGLDYASALDRYDLVLHMVTAADGAEAAYTTANNAARYETPEEARAQDARTLHVWQPHRARLVIDNSTPFAEKLERTWSVLRDHLKISEIPSRQRKLRAPGPAFRRPSPQLAG